MDDSDSENDSDEDGDENNKSVVIDNADHSDSSKEAEGSSDSVTEALHDIVSADVGTSESGSEEEKDSVVEESQGSGESEVVHVEAATVTELELGTSEEKTFQDGDKSSLQTSVVVSGAVQEEQGASDKSCFSDVGGSGSVNQAVNLSTSGEDKASIVGVSTNPISNLAAIQNEVVTTSAEAPNVKKPLNFEEINSASELEVICCHPLYSVGFPIFANLLVVQFASTHFSHILLCSEIFLLYSHTCFPGKYKYALKIVNMDKFPLIGCLCQLLKSRL